MHGLLLAHVRGAGQSRLLRWCLWLARCRRKRQNGYDGASAHRERNGVDSVAGKLGGHPRDSHHAYGREECEHGHDILVAQLRNRDAGGVVQPPSWIELEGVMAAPQMSSVASAQSAEHVSQLTRSGTSCALQRIRPRRRHVTDNVFAPTRHSRDGTAGTTRAEQRPRPSARETRGVARAYSNDCAAWRAQVSNGPGWTPRPRTTTAAKARAAAEAGETRAHLSSPAGSRMYMATTTRR